MPTLYLSPRRLSSTFVIEDPGSSVFPSFENKTPLDSAVAPLTLPSPTVGRGLYKVFSYQSFAGSPPVLQVTLSGYAGTVGLRYANPTYLAKRRPLGC